MRIIGISLAKFHKHGRTDKGFSGYARQYSYKKPGNIRASRLSKKWLNATFSSFALHKTEVQPREKGRNLPVAACLRAAKPAKYEALWGFIFSAAPPPKGASIAPAGQLTLCRQRRIEYKGLQPLIAPGFFRQTATIPRPCRGIVIFYIG